MWPDYKCVIHTPVPVQVEKAVMHMVSAHSTVCIFIYILSIQFTQWTELVYWSMNFLLQSCFSCNSLNHTHFIKLGFCSISKSSVHLTLSTWCQNDSDLAMEFITGAVKNLSVKIQISHASATYYARHNSRCITKNFGKKFNSACW
jgi:hypothetical protein